MRFPFFRTKSFCLRSECFNSALPHMPCTQFEWLNEIGPKRSQAFQTRFDKQFRHLFRPFLGHMRKIKAQIYFSIIFNVSIPSGIEAEGRHSLLHFGTVRELTEHPRLHKGRH